jgi:hypothetical protein
MPSFFISLTELKKGTDVLGDGHRVVIFALVLEGDAVELEKPVD